MGTFIVLIFLPAASAQALKKPKFDAGVPLTEAAAAERWGEFAANRLGGDFCMKFSITHRPRRGEDVKYMGVIMGAERGDAVYTRIQIAPAANPDAFESFIFKNGPRGSAVWKLENGKFAPLPPDRWFAPLCKGLLYSPFDIMMPYKFWDAKYAGSGRAGQPVNFFRLASAAFAQKTVEVALTKDFNVPAQIRIFAGGALVKTARLGSVKKIGDVWIMREASVKDESTKDSDVLLFTAGKFKISLPQSAFQPDSSAQIRLPKMDKF